MLRPRPTVRARLAVVLAALGLAGGPLAVAGCGGQAAAVRDAGAYTAKVNPIQESLRRDIGRLAPAIGMADDRRQIETLVDRLGRRIARAERELRAIRPPARVAAAHAQLVAALNGWRAPLEAFRRALGDRDRSATLRAKTRFDTASATVQARLNAAVKRINHGLRGLSD